MGRVVRCGFLLSSFLVRFLFSYGSTLDIVAGLDDVSYRSRMP